MKVLLLRLLRLALNTIKLFLLDQLLFGGAIVWEERRCDCKINRFSFSIFDVVLVVDEIIREYLFILNSDD